MKKVLHAIYLKHDLASQSLVVNALTQLIIKILYSKNDYFSIDEISVSLKSILTSNINTEKIEEALSELSKKSYINIKEGKYTLRGNFRDALSKKYMERSERYNRVIDKYFKKCQVPKEKISEWFDEINMKFFHEYSSEWINDLIGNSERKKNFDIEFVNNPKLYNKFQIATSERKWLKDQYISFLKSYDPDDNAIMWDYANSMFSSRLITSNIFADKSIKEIFENSIVVLDTNILIYLYLEEDMYCKAYEVLENIFIKLKITPIFFNVTKNEYKRAMSYKINVIKNTISNYNYEVYSKSNDIILKTAITRKCSTPADFDLFFEQLYEIPEKLCSKLKINEYDNNEIDKAIITGVKDKKLKAIMNEIYLRKHIGDKKDHSLEHDAGLIRGAEFLRNNHKCWILTRDITVHTYSLENILKDDLPIAINLDTIINLFAVYDGGIEIDSSDFVPLFANIIRNQLIPDTNTFQIEDLVRMHELEAQVSQLPNDKIISIAAKINNARIIGQKEKQIALEFHREIQSYKMEIQDELMSTKMKLNHTNNKNDKLSDNITKFRGQHYKKRSKELMTQYKNERRNMLLLSIPAFIFLMFILVFGYFYLNNELQLNTLKSSIVGLIINLISTFICSKYIMFPFYNKSYNNKIKKIDELIEMELKELEIS